MLIQDYQENYQISERNFINKICNFLNNLEVQFNKVNLNHYIKIAIKKIVASIKFLKL